MTQALKEINNSIPYFSLLSSTETSKALRKLLIHSAPQDFYSVVIQLSRHILNKTLETENFDFLEKFNTSLYILALPSTTKKDKITILENLPPAFFGHLHTIIIKITENGN